MRPVPRFTPTAADALALAILLGAVRPGEVRPRYTLVIRAVAEPSPADRDGSAE